MIYVAVYRNKFTETATVRGFTNLCGNFTIVYELCYTKVVGFSPSTSVWTEMGGAKQFCKRAISTLQKVDNECIIHNMNVCSYLQT